MSSSALHTINDCKEQLIKAKEQEDDERIKDVLGQLEGVQMTLELLTKTMIGKAVTPMKHHSTVGPRVKKLIQKWKQIAKGASSDTKTSSSAAKKEASNTEDDKIKEWQSLPPLRQTICQKLYDIFLQSKPLLIEQGIHQDAMGQLLAPRASEVEAALTEHFQNKQYSDKARSLCFNLKKNTSLVQQVVLGQVDVDTLVQSSSEELASAETTEGRRQEAQKLIDSKRLDWNQANEDKINEMCGIRGELLKASLFTCGRCKSIKTTSTQKQTRSADEPMTVFVLCLNCGNRWKC